MAGAKRGAAHFAQPAAHQGNAARGRWAEGPPNVGQRQQDSTHNGRVECVPLGSLPTDTVAGSAPVRQPFPLVEAENFSPPAQELPAHKDDRNCMGCRLRISRLDPSWELAKPSHNGWYCVQCVQKNWQEVRDWAASNGYDLVGVGGGKDDEHPVHSVSWYDVVKWCNAASERAGGDAEI